MGSFATCLVDRKRYHELIIYFEIFQRTCEESPHMLSTYFKCILYERGIHHNVI